MKLIYRARPGDEIPWWGGIAWVEDFGRCRAYSLLGMNLILRWLLAIRTWVGGYPDYDVLSSAEQEKIYQDGYNMAVTRMKREARNDIKQTS